MTTCIKCRQRYSEADHECLESMSLEELMADPYSGDLELDENGDFKIIDDTDSLKKAMCRLLDKKDE